jgi:hypothetical protein
VRKSFVEYITALGHWGWFVLVGVIGSTIGTITLAVKNVPIKEDFWLVILIVVLLVAPFIAFHNVRVQRDEAKSVSSGVATKIIAVSNYDYEFETSGDSIRLRLSPEIHAIPGVQVEDIQLEMRGKRYNTDWKPMEETISGDIGQYIYVNLSDALKSGTYQARLVAVIENKEYYSNSFDLKYEKPNLAT